MLQFLILFTIIASVAFFLTWRQSRKRLYELAEKIPGKPGIPLLGNVCEFIGLDHDDIFKYVYSMSFKKEYRDVAKAWLAHRLVIGLTNPKDIELVLSSNSTIKKAIEYDYFKPWFGNGLLISNGDVWKAHRKMIAPTFHLNVLKRFMHLFNRNSNRVIKRMATENGKTFDCHEYMSECMVETLLETVMGVKQKDEGRTCLSYAMAVMKMCNILSLRQTRLWLRSDLLFRFTSIAKENDHNLNVIFNLTNKILKKKKEDYQSDLFSKPLNKEEINAEEEKTNDKFSYGQASEMKDDIDENEIGEKKRLPFLESLIEGSHNEGGLTEKEIKDQVNTIMFEGHDTTAAASSFFLCILGDRQDIQEKCLEEIDTIFGKSERDVTFSDTIEMKYLERCIMETLRLFPPVPIIARALEHEIKLVSRPEIILPAGCTVLIGILKLHRRDDIYDNPEEFDPDNFLTEKAASRHYYSFIPFSAGPRSCVGRKYAMLKLKILLANILRKFRVKKGMPMKDWKLQGDIILKRSDGFQIALETRS